jgi:hypothetical protein
MATKRISSDVVVLQSRIKTREEIQKKAKRATVAIAQLLPMSQRRAFVRRGEAIYQAIVNEFEVQA